jgi:hypothetical protein
MKTINLSQGKVAVVDDIDFDLISQYHWYYHNGYAEAHTKNGQAAFSMHRLIFGLRPGDGLDVDHINHDTLDNRRCNLRVCTRSQNTMNSRKSTHNTSGYKGVYWRKSKRRWLAHIKLDGVDRYIGYFHTAEDAAHAYDQKAKQLFGEFACLNFSE